MPPQSWQRPDADPARKLSRQSQKSIFNSAGVMPYTPGYIQAGAKEKIFSAFGAAVRDYRFPQSKRNLTKTMN